MSKKTPVEHIAEEYVDSPAPIRRSSRILSSQITVNSPAPKNVSTRRSSSSSLSELKEDSEVGEKKKTRRTSTDEEVKPSIRTRRGSLSKIAEDEKKLSTDSNTPTRRSTRAISTSPSKSADVPARRTRRSSQEQEIVEQLPARRTTRRRSSSDVQEDVTKEALVKPIGGRRRSQEIEESDSRPKSKRLFSEDSQSLEPIEEQETEIKENTSDLSNGAAPPLTKGRDAHNLSTIEEIEDINTEETAKIINDIDKVLENKTSPKQKLVGNVGTPKITEDTSIKTNISKSDIEVPPAAAESQETAECVAGAAAEHSTLLLNEKPLEQGQITSSNEEPLDGQNETEGGLTEKSIATPASQEKERAQLTETSSEDTRDETEAKTTKLHVKDDQLDITKEQESSVKETSETENTEFLVQKSHENQTETREEQTEIINKVDGLEKLRDAEKTSGELKSPIKTDEQDEKLKSNVRPSPLKRKHESEEQPKLTASEVVLSSTSTKEHINIDSDDSFSLNLDMTLDKTHFVEEQNTDEVFSSPGSNKENSSINILQTSISMKKEITPRKSTATKMTVGVEEVNVLNSKETRYSFNEPMEVDDDEFPSDMNVSKVETPKTLRRKSQSATLGSNELEAIEEKSQGKENEEMSTNTSLSVDIQDKTKETEDVKSQEKDNEDESTNTSFSIEIRNETEDVKSQEKENEEKSTNTSLSADIPDKTKETEGNFNTESEKMDATSTDLNAETALTQVNSFQSDKNVDSPLNICKSPIISTRTSPRFSTKMEVSSSDNRNQEENEDDMSSDISIRSVDTDDDLLQEREENQNTKDRKRTKVWTRRSKRPKISMYGNSEPSAIMNKTSDESSSNDVSVSFKKIRTSHAPENKTEDEEIDVEELSAVTDYANESNTSPRSDNSPLKSKTKEIQDANTVNPTLTKHRAKINEKISTKQDTNLSKKLGTSKNTDEQDEIIDVEGSESEDYKRKNEEAIKSMDIEYDTNLSKKLRTSKNSDEQDEIIDVEGSGSEDYERKNEYLDDMAEEEEEDTPSEGSNDIIDKGESIKSTDTEYDIDDSYDLNDSFIADDDEDLELLPGEGDDLEMEYVDKQKEKLKKIGTPKKKRIIQPEDSSSDDGTAVMPQKVSFSEKLTVIPNKEKKSSIPSKPVRKSKSVIKNSANEELDNNGSSRDAVILEVSDQTEQVEELIKTASNERSPRITPTPCIQVNLVEDTSSDEEIDVLNETRTSIKGKSAFEKRLRTLVDQEKSSTPNSTFAESPNTTKHNSSARTSSIVVHENISITEVQEGILNDKLQQVVKVFCAGIRSSNGNVSMNVSLDYVEPPQSPVCEIKINNDDAICVGKPQNESLEKERLQTTSKVLNKSKRTQNESVVGSGSPTKKRRSLNNKSQGDIENQSDEPRDKTEALQKSPIKSNSDSNETKELENPKKKRKTSEGIGKQSSQSEIKFEVLSNTGKSVNESKSMNKINQNENNVGERKSIGLGLRKERLSKKVEKRLNDPKKVSVEIHNSSFANDRSEEALKPKNIKSKASCSSLSKNMDLGKIKETESSLTEDTTIDTVDIENQKDLSEYSESKSEVEKAKTNKKKRRRRNKRKQHIEGDMNDKRMKLIEMKCDELVAKGLCHKLPSSKEISDVSNTKIKTKGLKRLQIKTKNYLQGDLVTDVKNRPRRLVKPSVVMDDSSWVVEENLIEPSISNMPKCDFKYSKIDSKDFKNQMLYNSRIKREATSNLLRKKGYFVKD